jgi:hypothetical protein
MTTKPGAALVKGAAPTAPKVVKLEVTRAFCMQGKRIEVGATLEVPGPLASELVTNGKATPYVEKPQAAAKTSGQEKSK